MAARSGAEVKRYTIQLTREMEGSWTWAVIREDGSFISNLDHNRRTRGFRFKWDARRCARRVARQDAQVRVVLREPYIVD